MERVPGGAPTAAARRAASAAASRLWPGLVEALTGRDHPPAWRWRSRRERWAACAALAVATIALCVVNAGTVHGTAGLYGAITRLAPPAGEIPPSAGQELVAVAVILPLLLVPRYPLLAWRAGWLALLLTPLTPAFWWGGWPWGPPQLLVVLTALCVAGVRCQRTVLWSMWALSLIPWLLWLIADVPHLAGPASATVILTAVTVAVDSAGSRLRAQRALAAQTERAEAERARLAVLEERGRIARELHDVVAHHMSLIAVRAETAPYRLGDLPESARTELGSLSELAREALTDMRRLLGVLRHDQRAELAPQPQLADLPGLVDGARRAGVPVELSIATALDGIPSGVGVCAYRIVQESLSNASQHSPGAAVTISVGQEPGAVLLRVANGPGGPARNGNGRGHGLTGMRERVALLGGSLSAAPAPDGGFVVSAVLPLGEMA